MPVKLTVKVDGVRWYFGMPSASQTAGPGLSLGGGKRYKNVND